MLVNTRKERSQRTANLQPFITVSSGNRKTQPQRRKSCTAWHPSVMSSPGIFYPRIKFDHDLKNDNESLYRYTGILLQSPSGQSFVKENPSVSPVHAPVFLYTLYSPERLGSYELVEPCVLTRQCRVCFVFQSDYLWMRWLP